MVKKRVLVLTDHMPWGHRAIARAIYSYLKEHERDNDSNYKVDYVEVKSELSVANDLYSFIYKYVPMVNKVTHKVSYRKDVIRKAKEMAMMNLPGIKKAINWYNPDLVISAYHFHTHCLAKLREMGRKKYELWSVVADPWTPNPFSFLEEVDLHLVYDEVGMGEAVRFGIDKEKILMTGWWVRPEIYNPEFKNKRLQIRKKLGFSDNRPVIFMGGGSLGTNSLAKIFPLLPFVKKKVGVIINTGEDKLMFNIANEYVKLLKKIKKDEKIVVKVFGWIDNMAEVLSAVDIVFGKAGPNFLFDVVAAGKPFVAITHIGGQEDGNIELIEKKKLGWVKEKSGEITDFFKDYIKKPEQYNKKYEENIRAEGERNRESLEIVRQRIIKCPTKSLL